MSNGTETLYERLERLVIQRQAEVRDGMGTPPHQYIDFPGIGTLYIYPATGPSPEDGWFEVGREGEQGIHVMSGGDEQLTAAARQAVQQFLEAVGG